MPSALAPDRSANSGKTVVFRADASPEIGGGHVTRCLALAEALARCGWRTAFASRPETSATVPALAASDHDLLFLDGPEDAEPEAIAARWPAGCDLLVVDHYERDAGFETACRPWAAKIMAIDDTAARPHDCDHLLDQNLGRKPRDYDGLVPQGCAHLLGPAYALLRPQFAALRETALARRRAGGPVRRILVGLGTTDLDNITGIVLEGVRRSGVEAEIDVVLGPNAPHLPAVRAQARKFPGRATVHAGVGDMAELMAGCDLAIGAGGSTSWERCCLGLPSLVVVTADNQRIIGRELARAGAADLLGWHMDVDADAMASALADLAASPARRSATAAAAAAVCDGRGASRAAMVLAPETARDGASVSLRPATLEDGDIMLEWQSHPNTRRFAGTPQAPRREEHFRWVNRKLGDPDCLFNIILHGDRPAGVLRLDHMRNNGAAQSVYRISILTEPGRYRLGIAGAALRNARRLLPEAVLEAEVLEGNTASHALFRRTGFAFHGDAYRSAPETKP